MWLIPGVVSLWLFIRTERQAARPLVPVALLGERALVSSLSMNLLVGAIMMSTLVVGPFFLFFGLRLKKAETGMVMAMGPLAAALSGVPAGRIPDRFGVRQTLMLGLLQSGMGLCCFAIFPHFMGVAGYVIALVLITPGFQLFMAANNTAVMARAAEEHKGLLSGLLGLSRNLGFMAGASLLPLVFASLLRVIRWWRTALRGRSACLFHYLPDCRRTLRIGDCAGLVAGQVIAARLGVLLTGKRHQSGCLCSGLTAWPGGLSSHYLKAPFSGALHQALRDAPKAF